MFKSFIDALMLTLEFRDHITYNHCKRVSLYVKEICLIMNLSEEQELYTIAGLVHDIGKIGIPESILFKSKKLDDTEYTIIKKHVELGYSILSKLKLPQEFKELPEIVKAHHETLDGAGYPLKLKKIPFGSQIITVCDVFDAISSRRQYRSRAKIREIINILESEAGNKLNHDIIKAFKEIKLKRLIEILELREQIDQGLLELSEFTLNDLNDDGILDIFQTYYSQKYIEDQLIQKLQEYQIERRKK